MARYEFGAGVGDFVVRPSDGLWGVGAGVEVTFWDAAADGNQYTDLLNTISEPIASVTSDEYGSLPRFYGPDGVTGMWASAGGTVRAYMDAHSITTIGGGGGAVESVNGMTGAVELVAEDVGAVPSTAAGTAGGVATLDENGLVPDEQLPAAAAVVSSVNTQTGAVVLDADDVGAVPTGTAVLLTGAQTVAGVKTFSSVPVAPAANPTSDNQLSRKGYVDAAAYAGEWSPADHGLAAWAFDPALAVSTGLFPGSGGIRVTAIRLRSAASLSRFVWFATGYAGGLQSGSWAGLYSSAGARVAMTGDMSTATYEPAEQHDLGGGTISSPFTGAYSAAAGVYYVAWRMVYTSGTGPMMLAAESGAGAPPNIFGYTPIRRFGVYSSSSATTPPSSLVIANMENGANRFWAAVA
ncbi:hypothetical protein [Streptomyces niveus]|uniref:hypothetical protein n=1 Tax=Streptomyces niveus TaxID=193462 RepID=UPI0003C59897|nr:hypothetical protein [Streptomyces niveus]EST22764.1 hypothetical protein M877_28710 [Streptomyces niveus NCIMB 11891]